MKLESHKIELIRANRKDAKLIKKIEDMVFVKAECFSLPRIKYLLSKSKGITLLLFYNNRCIGYGNALLTRLNNGTVKGRIYSLGILPDYQHRQGGSLLLKALEKWLRNKKAKFITLETPKGKAGAKAFFEKTGYTVSETLPNYYNSGDGIRMKKLLSSHGILRKYWFKSNYPWHYN